MLIFLSWDIEVFRAARNKLTVTSIQQHVPTPPSRFLSLLFPLNLKQRQKQLYAAKEVHWDSGPQMVIPWVKYKTVLLIADSEKNNK